MPIDANWMEEHILLHKLNGGSQSLLDEVLELVHFQTGDEIISQGATGGQLYILRSGLAVITQKMDGRSIYLGHANEGDLFGEMSFLNGTEPSATVTAHSDCIAYKLDLIGYCKLVTRDHELLLSLFTYILTYSGNKLRRMNEQYIARA